MLLLKPWEVLLTYVPVRTYLAELVLCMRRRVVSSHGFPINARHLGNGLDGGGIL